ncbi:MAG TPA: hypothetical protein VI072_31565 [Polyangiaceae bacterium]
MSTKKLRDELARDVDELVGLRDEVRLKVHLASLDAKATWKELEERFTTLQEHASSHKDEIVENGVQLARDIRKAIHKFRQTL